MPLVPDPPWGFSEASVGLLWGNLGKTSTYPKRLSRKGPSSTESSTEELSPSIDVPEMENR